MSARPARQPSIGSILPRVRLLRRAATGRVTPAALEMVPPTSARLTKGAEGHIRLIAKRETIKSWREIVTAKHETTISWHETKINMIKSKIEDS